MKGCQHGSPRNGHQMTYFIVSTFLWFIDHRRRCVFNVRDLCWGNICYVHKLIIELSGKRMLIAVCRRSPKCLISDFRSVGYTRSEFVVWYIFIYMNLWHIDTETRFFMEIKEDYAIYQCWFRWPINSFMPERSGCDFECAILNRSWLSTSCVIPAELSSCVFHMTSLTGSHYWFR